MVSDVVAVSAMTIIGGIVTLVITRWLNRIDAKLAKADVKQDIIHGQIDGKMEQLLTVTGAKERAEGINEGIAQKQGEVDQLNKEAKPDIPKKD